MDKSEVINLPKILDTRGNISFIQSMDHIPFDVKRVYWIYDVPGGEIRGGHAYRDLSEFIVSLSGSFDLVIHDGKSEKRYHLNRSYYGVYVPKLLWRHLENFSTNAVAMILASDIYNANDYIRDFSQFKELVK